MSMVRRVTGHHVYPAGPWEHGPAVLLPAQSDVAVWYLFSGAVEHTAHPSDVLSLLWPPGFTVFSSEQAEQ